MSQRKSAKLPAWYKNTYFWISGLLLIVGVIGLVFGDNAIRDPGQKIEHGLCWLYFIAAVVMLAGGWVSHRQTVQQFQEEKQTK